MVAACLGGMVASSKLGVLERSTGSIATTSRGRGKPGLPGAKLARKAREHKAGAHH